MRIVVLLLVSLVVSMHAHAQETFECHVKDAPFARIIDILQQQTGCILFFQGQAGTPDIRITMDEKMISVKRFLRKYLGLRSSDYKRDGKTFVIKKAITASFIASLTPAPSQDNSAGAQKVSGFGNETLPGVIVVPISNGYQHIPKDRATGSFGFIDRALITRTISTDVMSRLENTIPGVSSNHGQSAAGIPIQEIPQIRGLSTIYANASPLFVLDNFPYDGDINNINPNDIDNITVLKDAAAASIWGVRAGNGVIVINTRKGKLSDSLRTLTPVFSYSTSVTWQPRPDVFNVSRMSSADFIDRERTLFNNGYYASPSITTPETPVVEDLSRVAAGTLDPNTANNLIAAMRSQDVYRDMEKYFYRGSANQQHYLQASAATTNAAYYFSTGWDHNLSDVAGSSYDRVTMRLHNVLKISTPLTIETGISFTHTTTRANGNPGFNYQSTHGHVGFYPYAGLADVQGNPRPVYLDYSPGYRDDTHDLTFPDWSYSPLKDMQARQYIDRAHDLLINVGAHYAFTRSLNLELKYQYETGGSNGNDLHDGSSYYARDLINSFIQVDPNTNSLSFPIPQGGILDMATQETISHQGRVQLNFNHNWGRQNNVTAIGGYEIKSLTSTVRYDREYGYNPVDGSYVSGLDYAGSYSAYQQFTPMHIPSPAPTAQQVDHFLSYYINASYTLHNIYTLSASAREDAANLFGANTNQKTKPLWSAGLAWQINHERFYHIDWLSTLKLRATYGRNGNISRLASAYTTATYSQGGFTGTPYNVGYIQGLSNPDLRWEQVGVFNLGLDFAMGKTITGSFEYYHKHATDLMGAAPGDPTLGLVQIPGIPGYYYANSATMNGSGIDLQLEAHILDGQSSSDFKWTSNFIFSKTVSKVRKYLLTTSAGTNYLDQHTINPHSGQPIYAINSFKWKGLDNMGDPMGYYNGKPSKDWTSIINNTSIDSMVYNGPSQPTIFGSLRNTFEWRHFSLSFNISYKLGYYFRRPSISYSDLFNHWTGNADYALRWQQPGDEARTIVPAAGDPNNVMRDRFYLNSSALVEKADHIRLEDIVITYDLEKKDHSWLPFEKIRFYNYLSNLGLLWRANKSGIDPYYINIPKEARRISLGVNINF
ncbi:MAG TPA: SusC/RagA family TonB-linked outer membrane protein [Puia sp.]|nr:SusC/RagA family TonB-linked outer membrane protein [Puia sp.]